MNALRFAFCFLCFFLDVHVRADETAASVIQAKHKYVLKSPNVILEKGALAELRAPDSLHLVRGHILVQGPGHFTAPFATLSCEGECTAVIKREPRKVTLFNIRGDWQVERKGDKQTYAVPPAMQVAVTEVDTDGKAGMDFPQGLPWLPTVKTWGRLYGGSASEFKADLEEFRAVWEQAVEAVSDLHSRTAAREIANADRALAQEQARKRAREKEDAELRKLFREKNSL